MCDVSTYVRILSASQIHKEIIVHQMSMAEIWLYPAVAPSFG